MSNIFKDENLKQFLNPDHSLFYIKEIFKNCEVDSSLMLECRKIGDYRMLDGSKQQAEQTSAAQIMQFDQDDWQEGFAQWTARMCDTAAPIGIGTFMAPALLDDRRATDASVKFLVTVCADFDTGNPAELLDALCAQIGVRPTIVATSGGTTKEGFPKLHAHWRLDEPCDEPWKVAYIREQIAKKFGADDSFKRIPQIIRIPGSLYDKKENWGTTIIIEHNDVDTSMMQWEECFSIDWEDLEEDSIFHPERKVKTKEQKAERLHSLQTEEVSEGRVDDTRFDRFSEYAGHQIRQTRFGHQSEGEALQSTKIWNMDKMVPAWEEHRVVSEFQALLGRDKVNHPDVWADINKPALTLGAAPVAPNAPAGSPALQLTAANDQMTPAEANIAEALSYGKDNPWLKMFSASSLYAGEAPKERHTIENFLVYGSTVGLVADGGVGKTYVSLELALRAAAGPCEFKGQTNRFMGFEVLEKHIVIVLTVEDQQHDLHRRMCAIDSDGSLREASEDRCIVVPVREQILDGLTLAAKDSQGNYGPSKAWEALVDHMGDLIGDDPQHPVVVIIDTYSATHHSDENSATGTNEWFRSTGLLRKFEAALIVTHHTRKADLKMEIKTPADMKANVRGSTSFVNSLRTIYGIWSMPNAASVIKEMEVAGVEKGAQIFNMGILKNNTGIDWSDRSDPRYPDPMITLRRLGSGRLIYDEDIHKKRIELTSSKKVRIEEAKRQLKAAIVHSVREYAANGWPLTKNLLSKEREQFLPVAVNVMAQKDIVSAVEELLTAGTIKAMKIKGISGGLALDVADGPFSATQKSERVPEMPVFQWASVVYDEENEQYDEIPNMQHVIDL